MAGGCHQAPESGETEERGSRVLPTSDFSQDCLLLAGRSLEDPGFWVGAGGGGCCWGWISGVMNIHQPSQPLLLFT